MLLMQRSPPSWGDGTPPSPRAYSASWLPQPTNAARTGLGPSGARAKGRGKVNQKLSCPSVHAALHFPALKILIPLITGCYKQSHYSSSNPARILPTSLPVQFFFFSISASPRKKTNVLLQRESHFATNS